MNKFAGMMAMVMGFLLFLLLPPYMVTKFGDPWLYFLYFASWVPGGFFVIAGIAIVGSNKKKE